MSKPVTKTERPCIRMTPEFRKKLQTIADSENRTFSNLCEIALKQYIKEHEQNNNKM